MVAIRQYETTAGPASEPPRHWPSSTNLHRSYSDRTLVLVAHPKCSCTRALHAAISAIANEYSAVATHVVFFRPMIADDSWQDSELRRTALANPALRVTFDAEGREMQRFGVRTSGHAVLYSAGGALEFTGGVTTVKRNAECLLALINDILDLSKIEAGKMDSELVPLAPVEMLHEVVSLMHVRAAAKNLALALELPSRMPARILTDPFRLRQVLVNLVGNAIKFTETGAVRIVAGIDDSQRLRIDVTDSGIGMTPEQQSRLFQPFTQADNSITRRYGGTGLGLTISKRLVELLGGTISVHSEPGTGSTFSIWLPFDGAAESDYVASDIVQVSPSAYMARQASPVRLTAKVLLAEDGPDNRRLIEYVVRKAGAELIAVENDAEAVEAIAEHARSGQPFDVVLMDMHMTVLDGYSAAR